MPDQFSKTISSDAIEPISTGSRVQPAHPATGKRVERERSVTDQHPEEKHHLYSHYDRLPDPELWDVLVEAIERFNDHAAMRHSPYTIRLWAQSTAFRIQLIQEDTGDLVKQTQLIPFRDVTVAVLDRIINSLIGEEGIVIDVMR